MKGIYEAIAINMHLLESRILPAGKSFVEAGTSSFPEESTPILTARLVFLAFI